MKIKAIWRPIIRNPFNPNVHMIPVDQFKVVEVPDNTNMEQLEEYAKQDTPDRYVFDRIEVVPNETPLSPKND